MSRLTKIRHHTFADNHKILMTYFKNEQRGENNEQRVENNEQRRENKEQIKAFRTLSNICDGIFKTAITEQDFYHM